MPSYHLKRPGGGGITLVNIGVGPSNAKTATDHIAVLRPHAWLMLGHCAGLRNSQSLGDYVLAHAYVREDNVLDADLPVWVPIPALAEIQIALERAVAAGAQVLLNLNASPFHEGKSEEREALVVTEDSLDTLIRENVAPESWDEDPNNSLRITSGTLSWAVIITSATCWKPSCRIRSSRVTGPVIRCCTRSSPRRCLAG